MCSRCQSWGLWVWAQKVTSDTREHSLSLGITVIIGGRGRGRKGRREGRKKGMRGEGVPSAQNFLPSLHSQFPVFFQVPSHDPHRNSELPIGPARWQTTPVTQVQSRLSVGHRLALLPSSLLLGTHPHPTCALESLPCFSLSPDLFLAHASH